MNVIDRLLKLTGLAGLLDPRRPVAVAVPVRSDRVRWLPPRAG